MTKPWNDPVSWPALFADTEAADNSPAAEALARLSEQIGARRWQRRRARAAIEFNARLPAPTRLHGIRTVRPPASGSAKNAGQA